MAGFAAGALEIAGGAGLVLTEFAADLGQGLIGCVVEAEALFVARVEQAEGDFEGAVEERDELGAVRVVWRGGDVCDGLRRGEGRCGRGRGTVVGGFDWSEAAAGADGINVALGEDGTKPRLERTSAMR